MSPLPEGAALNAQSTTKPAGVAAIWGLFGLGSKQKESKVPGSLHTQKAGIEYSPPTTPSYALTGNGTLQTPVLSIFL